MMLIELIKTLILGMVEGITEWLPISSTGHMLLVDEFVQLDVTPEFKEMFLYVIQLGAILAVVILFWDKMWPFNCKDKSKPVVKKETFSLWFKVVVACIPGAIVTLLFDDYVEAHFQTPTVIAIALIFYGILFILIENWNKKRTPKTLELQDITYKTAFIIGMFQVLSIIPGTSRSGSTIIGALTIGVSRVAAAEFTFFLAVPVMIGMSLIKIAKFVMAGTAITGAEIAILAVGCVVAFAVSVFVIKFLMSYIKKKDFKVFGWYRIILGAVVLLYFLVIK
ncbi:MAG: undecaprenyl-diphosphate phosphatase [Bacillota bacterium]|nr:undecaprenyl-diphosphate phosphatase [Bacillota bacterium]